jgi:hypothetical protein
MRLGDLIFLITKFTGIKWLTELVVVKWLGYNSCGCNERREKLNEYKFTRK